MTKTEALARKLAGMKGTCDAVGGCTYLEDGGECARCNRTGKVYLLDDSVRVKCLDRGEEIGWKDGVHVEFGYVPFLDDSHSLCDGRGWIPSRNFVVWRKAIACAGYHVEERTFISGKYVVRVRDGEGKRGLIGRDAEAILMTLAQDGHNA